MDADSLKAVVVGFRLLSETNVEAVRFIWKLQRAVERTL